MIGTKVKIEADNINDWEEPYELLIKEFHFNGGDLIISGDEVDEPVLGKSFQVLTLNTWVDLESGWEVNVTETKN